MRSLIFPHAYIRGDDFLFRKANALSRRMWSQAWFLSGSSEHGSKIRHPSNGIGRLCQCGFDSVRVAADSGGWNWVDKIPANHAGRGREGRIEKERERERKKEKPPMGIRA